MASDGGGNQEEGGNFEGVIISVKCITEVQKNKDREMSAHVSFLFHTPMIWVGCLILQENITPHLLWVAFFLKYHGTNNLCTYISHKQCLKLLLAVSGGCVS